MAQAAVQPGRRGVMLLVSVVLVAISGRIAACQCILGAVRPPGIVTPVEQMPAYEVATIKPRDPRGFAMPLRFYIQQAFGMSPNRVGWVIGPDWINNTGYAIEGKPPDSIREAMQAMTGEERSRENALMMQSLLADRFQLKAHFETREMPVYDLVPAKGGAKLKEETDPAKRRVAMGSAMILGSGTIHQLIDVLECSTDLGGRAVVDKTGLTGEYYDLSLRWMPQRSAAASGGENGAASTDPNAPPELFTAIQEQLGLKLIPAKGPGQVLAIDRIERPSEN